ncbi:hypothetical protein [Brevundimonas sp. A19_0]|uniref:hypothetical protein n=1 Tax=Brevundimonas sp. A19_0 TaxID=2821087 RepID=UPI001ADA2D6B|nr:hypothetical protein [Brevundimonas sp. A19_0]MBO9500084.1 hypothetical protein [Brevundimonas sp. A19_0]
MIPAPSSPTFGSAMPEPLYREARRGILQRFLERPSLYFSDWGQATFEDQARENLAASITALG